MVRMNGRRKLTETSFRKGGRLIISILMVSSLVVLGGNMVSMHFSQMQTSEENRLLKTVVVPTIAYAVSITGCSADSLADGAAVLKHSIHRASMHGNGKYDYALFAFHHPSAKTCVSPLAELGYTLLEREIFVNVSDIEGDFLREKIEKNGCCGEKEFLKLEAYTLTNFPIVVHLDLDVLIHKPIDELFDAMLTPNGKHALSPTSLQWPNREMPEEINAFFTVDYNMKIPAQPGLPVQGGFLVTRPDMAVYEEFREIVRKGDFRSGEGWGGEVGWFWGGMTFQGIIPYYYYHRHTNRSVELNRCVYNQMVDGPLVEKTKECRTGEQECEDCRKRPPEDIVTSHFTICLKPWRCVGHGSSSDQSRLCKSLTSKWFSIRSEMESSWGRPSMGNGTHYSGFCSVHGENGYIPIAKPYGPPAN